MAGWQLSVVNTNSGKVLDFTHQNSIKINALLISCNESQPRFSIKINFKPELEDQSRRLKHLESFKEKCSPRLLLRGRDNISMGYVHYIIDTDEKAVVKDCLSIMHLFEPFSNTFRQKILSILEIELPYSLSEILDAAKSKSFECVKSKALNSYEPSAFLALSDYYLEVDDCETALKCLKSIAPTSDIYKIAMRKRVTLCISVLTAHQYGHITLSAIDVKQYQASVFQSMLTDPKYFGQNVIDQYYNEMYGQKGLRPEVKDIGVNPVTLQQLAESLSDKNRIIDALRQKIKLLQPSNIDQSTTKKTLVTHSKPEIIYRHCALFSRSHNHTGPDTTDNSTVFDELIRRP